MHYLYILKCADKLYYTGITNNLERRIRQHRNSHANFTKTRLPIKLVYFEKLNSKKEAIKREKEIKGWSRIKKEKLFLT